jgi:Domain of unknown function (DUF3576).|tara:strand:- start:212 stop:715 length:504 start_codon:yes stop_codon:yes gene_type:complete
VFLSSCEALKYKPVDAKEYPPEPEKRVQKNLEEGKGFRLFGKDDEQGGNFDFASANPLWRASLETIDFLPLMSANYSGGIIISDWYSGSSNNESIKITIRFLSNEVRADALDIKIFSKKCGAQSNCTITENNGQIVKDIKKKILKQAAIYEKEFIKKNKKKYLGKIR